MFASASIRTECFLASAPYNLQHIRITSRCISEIHVQTALQRMFEPLLQQLVTRTCFTMFSRPDTLSHLTQTKNAMFLQQIKTIRTPTRKPLVYRFLRFDPLGDYTFWPQSAFSALSLRIKIRLSLSRSAADAVAFTAATNHL